MSANKSEMRSRLLNMRENLDPKAAQQLSETIFSNLTSLEQFTRAKVIHTYVSSKKNEVDTKRLIEDAWQSGKRVVVPIMNLDHQTLEHSEILSLDELKPGAFDILEPTTRRSIDLTLVEIVVVPVLGVDRRGNRIGFGEGYYDRFLKFMKKPKVALAYEFQVVEKMPSSEVDVPVDYVVTEKKVIVCS